MPADTLAENLAQTTPVPGTSDITYGGEIRGQGTTGKLPSFEEFAGGATPAAPAADKATQLFGLELKNRLGLDQVPDLSNPQVRDVVNELLSRQSATEKQATPAPGGAAPAPAQAAPAPGGGGGQPVPPAQATPDQTVPDQAAPAQAAPTEKPPDVNALGYPIPNLAEQMKTGAQTHKDNLNMDQEDLLAKLQNSFPDAKYDPTTTMPPLPAYLIGRQIGMKNWEDVQTEFERQYPYGNLVTFESPSDDTEKWFYRSGPDAPFRPLGVGATVGSVSNARTIGNLGVTVIGGPELGIVKLAGLTGAATSVGDYMDYLANRANGFSKNIGALSEAQRAGLSGAEASIPLWAAAAVLKVGGASFRLSSKIGNWITTKLGAIAQPDLAGLNQKAIDIGLQPLTYGQVGPELVQLAARQAAATTGKMRKVTLAQLESVRQFLEKKVAENANTLDPALLKSMTNAQRDALLATLPINKMGYSVAGMSAQSGLKTWLANSRALIQALGKKAGEAAGDTWVGMPMAPLKDAADRIRVGVLAPAASGGKNVVQLAPPTEEIKPYLDLINKIGDRLSTVEKDGVTHNTFDQFIQLRSGLYRLWKEGGDSDTRQQAKVLWDATHEMADQAASEIGGKQGAQLTGEFRDFSKRFFDTYKETEQSMETLEGMINSKDPGGMAKALMAPGNLKTLLTVKGALSEPELNGAWQAVVDGFRSNIMENLTKGGKLIEQMQARDPQMLDAVLSRGEQETWKDLGRLNEQAEASLSGKLGDTVNSVMENATQIARKASKNEIDRMVAQTGGHGGEYATSVRAGIWHDIINGAKSIDEKTGLETISADGLNAGIRRYMIGSRRDALDSVMTAKDWELMGIVRQYSAIVGADATSISGGLAAGSTVSKLTDIHGVLFGKAKFFTSMLKVLNEHVISNALATEVGGKLVGEAMSAPDVPTAMKFMLGAASYVSETALHQPKQVHVIGGDTPP